MSDSESSEFPPGVAEQLKYYVYRLIDPRDGETFYVGKGNGNRVFDHARAEIDFDDDIDEISEKLKRIREIRLRGFEVAHVIHRHGLDEETAIEVEAALIDAYPGLSNAVGGQDSDGRGAMHAREIVAKYCADEAVFKDKALLISVNRSATERDLYEAVRYAWKINTSKAAQADVILATKKGLIVGAFKASKWLPANAENFPSRWIEGGLSEGRHGFIGVPASTELHQRYVGKRVPSRFRKRGAASPIRYTW